MKQNTDKLDKYTEPLLGLIQYTSYITMKEEIWFISTGVTNILHLDHDLVVTAAAHAEMTLFKNDF
jgi:hypothetical protein